MHCVQLVVKSHGQVGGCARGYVGDEWRLALVHGVIHIHPPLADLHILEAGLDTVQGKGRQGDERKSPNQPTNQQRQQLTTAAVHLLFYAGLLTSESQTNPPCTEEGQMGVRMRAAAWGLLSAPMELSISHRKQANLSVFGHQEEKNKTSSLEE